MCGISGIYSIKSDIKYTWIKKITDTIKHRGPDDEGFFLLSDNKTDILGGEDTPVAVYKSHFKYSPTFQNKPNDSGYKLALGHRRLSIIDLSPAGHQPMSTDDGQVWIVYNGEIYNYIEIRESLVNLGYKFISNSDTEVLLKAYIEWGYDCLNKLNGMWAFVILDKRKNTLFGSRDRFGVKPFYYYHDASYFSFSSEIKSIIKLPFYNRGINKNVAFNYLVRGRMEFGNETFFKNIYELEPANAFIFNIKNNSLHIWKYFQLNVNLSWEKFNKKKSADYIENVKNLVYNAVDLRLRSDVPVGTSLSGGIDSSSIVAIINEALKKTSINSVGNKQKVFTACYNDQRIDESNWAEKAVNSSNVEWFKTYPLENEFIQDLEDLIYSQDVPFNTTSVYAQYRIMKLVSQNNVKVLIDGQGGDELFGGYSYFYQAFFSEIIRNGDFARLISECRNLKNSPIQLKSILLGMTNSIVTTFLPATKKNILNVLLSDTQKKINPNFWSENKSLIFSSEANDYVYFSLNEMLAAQISNNSLKHLLKTEDRNSMRFSIESRTPFSDDLNLINYLFSIPSSYKIFNGWSKYLFRESMDGTLIEDIRLRKDKIGFVTPENIWLKNNMHHLVEYITPDLEEFVDVKLIRNNFISILDATSLKRTTFQWRLICFAVWKKVFNV